MNIIVSKEGGFADVAIPVKEIRLNENSRHIILEGILEGQSAGIEIIIPNVMEPGVQLEDNEMQIINVYDAMIKSTGTETNNLFEILSKLYDIQISEGLEGKEILLKLLPMEQNAYDIEKQAIRTKVFFEKPEEQYFEMFFNFDLPNNYVQLCEKDQEYRGNILTALKGLCLN